MSKNEKDNLSEKIQINCLITLFATLYKNAYKIRDCVD